MRNAAYAVMLVLSATAPFVPSSSALAQTVPDTRAQSQAASPLLIEEGKIRTSPAEIHYAILRASSPKFNLTFAQIAKIPQPQRADLVSDVYYTMAVDRATMLTRGRADLADIINTIGSGNQDLRQVALDFEARYFAVFGVYPDIVPVDSEALLQRMLNRSKVQ